MKREINLKGWIPNDETLAESEKLIRQELKRTDIFSKTYKDAKIESGDFKAKKLNIKIIIS